MSTVASPHLMPDAWSWSSSTATSDLSSWAIFRPSMI
jgi:hypothetical protein